MKHVVRYLAGTINYGLILDGYQTSTKIAVDIYTDASWAADINDRKSTTGTLVKVNGCPINWFSKKQQTVSLSTAEAEYMAISSAGQEALWYKTWFSEVLQIELVPTIITDNKAALSIAKNPTDHNRTKHISIRHHFIRDHISRGNVTIIWKSSAEQQADILTKAISSPQFIKLRNLMLQPIDEQQHNHQVMVKGEC
jgi:hypothetical protein